MRICTILLAVAVAACASSNEHHESVTPLSLHAKVVASDVSLPSQLKPALAFTPWTTLRGHTEYFVGGKTTGAWDGFSLVVTEPPPAAAIVTLTHGEPDIALGAVTALAPQHPDHLDWYRQGEVDHVCADSGDCFPLTDEPCEPLSLPECLGTLVRRKNWGKHGIAERLIVVYLTESVAAGSTYALFFNRGEALPKGYSLVGHYPMEEALTQAEQLRHFQCYLRAIDGALAQFNVRYGTQYANETLLQIDAGRDGKPEWLTGWDGALIQWLVRGGCLPVGAQQVVVSSAEEPLPISWIEPDE